MGPWSLGRAPDVPPRAGSGSGCLTTQDAKGNAFTKPACPLSGQMRAWASGRWDNCLNKIWEAIGPDLTGTVLITLVTWKALLPR